MFQTAICLTVFFEYPFWVGVFQKTFNGKITACKIIFGSEPADGEIYFEVLKNWDSLEFSSGVKIDKDQFTKINPKRMQRKISKQLQEKGSSTKSQLALSLQMEQKKEAGAKLRKKRKEELAQLKFSMRLQKKKQKHKGK